ncbi:MAG: PIG-L family deacetylase [Roseiflexaceae bacterium]|nr:PIG-L family deacetylase [Roseiflexaceae bacterium]
MLFHDLRQLHGRYAHVYLSPHMDDVSLSCGGAIAGQRAAGEAVLVVTICTAAPPATGPFSTLAEEFHREWGLSAAEAVAARLREDQDSMAVLDVDSLLVGMLDALYRQPAVYDRRETLFGTPAAGDPLVLALRDVFAGLRERLPVARFYAPLGVGSHVDHLITYQAAAECWGPTQVLYEDFPYVVREGELDRRLAQVGGDLRPVTVAIAPHLQRKLRAICAYTSQIDELAHSQLGHQVSGDEAIAVMRATASAYMHQVGGERFWERGLLPG